MKKVNYLKVIILLAVIVITVSSCSSERRASGGKGCGCNAHKGFVGY